MKLSKVLAECMEGMPTLSKLMRSPVRRNKNREPILAVRYLTILSFFLLAACGNSPISCSDADSKLLLKQTLTENYQEFFGRFSYVVEPGTIEPHVSAIATLSSDFRSASCSAHISFTYQNRKVTDPKSQSDIDGAVMIIGARTSEISYKFRKTDDGQLELRMNAPE